MATEDDKNAAPEGSVIIELKKPIKAHGEDVTTLICRPPTASDIISIGNPVKYGFTSDGRPDITYDDSRMARMISVLAGIPPSSVAQIAPREFIAVEWALRDFFLPA